MTSWTRKSTWPALFCAGFSLGMLSCGPEEKPPQEPVGLTSQACPEGFPAHQVFVDGQIAPIGPSANQVGVALDGLYVLESGTNTISRFDLLHESWEPFFIDLGNDRNPYGMALDEVSGEVWVANYSSHTLSRASLLSGDILQEIDDPGFQNPSAVALSRDRVFVANVNYRGLQEGFGPGSITVLDRETGEVLQSWETTFKNPHYLDVITLEGEEILVAMTNGSFNLTGPQVRLDEEGGMEWWTLRGEKRGVFSVRQEESQGQVGAPGRPHLSEDGKTLYAVSATAAALFAFDLEAMRWRHDAVNPISLYEGAGDLTHHSAFSAEGVLGITAFNEDGLLFFDTRCEALISEMIDLGKAANILEGAHSLIFYRRGEILEVYVVLGIANGLWRVRLVPFNE